MSENPSTNQFADLLNATHKWPCQYLFKFIVKTELLAATIDLFRGNKISTKESQNKKYTSVTMEMRMDSSEEVLAVYHRAKQIPGLIAL